MTLDRRRLLAAGLLLALGGCAGRAGVTLVTRPGPEVGELEALAGVSAHATGVVVRVASVGCTRKEDFAFYVDRSGGAPAVAFARKRLDVCRQAPTTTLLTFSYAELGLAPEGTLRVLNPVRPGSR